MARADPLFAMKSLALACLALLFALPLRADPVGDIARTRDNTLNDLVRRLPILSLSREEELRKLSAIQELLVLFEKEMRGEGLPPELAAAFSRHYSAIIEALVDDRIDEPYGRDLLSVHRQLLGRTREWFEKPVRLREESFDEQVLRNIEYFLDELERESLAIHEVPRAIRTPVINGYQVWVGELLAWGRRGNELSRGDATRIESTLADLERFECDYKEDDVLKFYEREQLHERLIELTRKTIDRIEK